MSLAICGTSISNMSLSDFSKIWLLVVSFDGNSQVSPGVSLVSFVHSFGDISATWCCMGVRIERNTVVSIPEAFWILYGFTWYT